MEYIKNILELTDKFQPWSLISFFVLLACAGSVLVIGKKAEEVDKSYLSGDSQLERIQNDLKKMSASPQQPTESEVIGELKQLFDRPAFILENTESIQQLLYDICASRLIIQQNLHFFKDGDNRRKLTKTVEILAHMQTHVGEMLENNLNVSEHIQHYINNQQVFLAKLPGEKTPRNFAKRDQDLDQINAVLATL
jgi:hypothetical protein